MNSVGFLFLLCLCIGWSATTKLDSYNVDSSTISVSGVSSGGFMAIQLHVAHSSSYMAVGVIAGGPYWCANADVLVAETSCMEDPALIVVEELVLATTFARDTLTIDNPDNLADDKVYLFSGTQDTVVDQGVVDKTQSYYENFLPSANIKFVSNYSAEHAWITDSWGSDCENLGSPYINNCDYDLAGDMLTHFYGKLKNRVEQADDNLFEFSQEWYVPLDALPILISMDSTGYIYVPTSCQNNTRCKLHVALHGCEQGTSYVGNEFAKYTGLNEWAEANNIIILYPQATSAVLPYNPNGCWDWWGYTGLDYATNLAPQIITIQNMVSAITGV